MPADRKLTDEKVARALDWGRRRDALETKEQIAAELGVAPPTIDRIIRDGGYKPKKLRPRIAELMKRTSERNRTVQSEERHG